MSKKNPVNRVLVFRWKSRSDYAIMIARKRGIRFFENVGKERAIKIHDLAKHDLRFDYQNHNTPSSIDSEFWRKAKAKPLYVYVVSCGIDGYLPDSVSAYSTLESAIEAAKDEKRFLLDGLDCTVSGNIRSDWEYTVNVDGRYHTSIRIDRHHVSEYESEWDNGVVDSRVKLDSFCEYYNQHNG